MNTFFISLIRLNYITLTKIVNSVRITFILAFSQVNTVYNSTLSVCDMMSDAYNFIANHIIAALL